MSRKGEQLGRLAKLTGARLVGGHVENRQSVQITDVTHDSRAAGPGTMFVAIRGFKSDGHDFVGVAVAAGSPAVVVETPSDIDVVQLVVDDTRNSLGPLADAVHDHPSTKLDVVGVTGTNGKTSVTRLLESIAVAGGHRAGVIGTLGIRVVGSEIAGERTTPEADDLQRLLVQMLEARVSVVASEVSSHALALGRVDATRFRVAAFTNLSPDHLDFHNDMESYFATKASLFTPERADEAVIWVDDISGRRLAEMAALPTTTVGSSNADIEVTVTDVDVNGSVSSLAGGGFHDRLRLPLPGVFMVANAAIAATVAHRLGWGKDAIVDGLASAEPIPGRFEPIENDLGIGIIVDYSHTPAGIEAAIDSARRITSGSVIAVFGAGGERDAGKRPLMGAAASRADVVIVTSDNPRSEDPAAIMDQVMNGITTQATQIADRRGAIRRGIQEAKPGDIVLIMGKGHERYQEIDGEFLPFDDRIVASEEAHRT